MNNSIASLDRVDPWDGRRVEKPALTVGVDYGAGDEVSISCAFLPQNGYRYTTTSGRWWEHMGCSPDMFGRLFG